MAPPSSEIGFTKTEFDADRYRAELRAMTDEELLKEGKELNELVSPRTVSPMSSVFESKWPLARERVGALTLARPVN